MKAKDNKDTVEGNPKKKKGRVWKRLMIAVLAIVLLYLVLLVVNICCAMSLRKYIDSFEPVKYGDDRLVPVKYGDYYTYYTDRDLNIMHITDIHIGGGFWTYKNDKKTVYELITMIQKEKPDLVVLGGDNTYCLFSVGYNGGNTFNNRMTARTVIEIFEHEDVYFTTVFGNHDTEAMDYANRQEIGELYMDDTYEHSIFEENFTDLDADTVPSVTNQFILVRNTEGKMTKVILLIDSNAYVDTSLMATIMGRYDVIHDAQVEWAKNEIIRLSKAEGLPDGEYLKCIVFLHIPIGEYRVALDDLITEVKDEDGNPVSFTSNASPKDTEFVDGVWGEELVCYGGLNNEGAPEDQDRFFEVMADELHSMEACFCGHDHTNSAVVYYKGVMLAYGHSVDNEAYGDEIMYVGLQRGATIVTIHPDGTFDQVRKNAYKDYGVDPDKFVHVEVDKPLYPDWYRTYER